MKSVLTLLTAAAFLAGCAVYTPRGAVVVDPQGSSQKGGVGNGGCPPGQAKKGNC